MHTYPHDPNLTQEEFEILQGFHGLYAGGLAMRQRSSGNSNAMPPWAETYWMGKQVVKSPTDLWTYQEIIVETRPDLIIETGTSGAGAAWFYATLFNLIGNGHVITVDIDSYPELWLPHPRITYLTGDSISSEISDQIRSFASGKRTMVSLDSLHTYSHVKSELDFYGELTSPGCYLVVEDTGWGNSDEITNGQWCCRAASEYVSSHPCFYVDKTREKHLLTSNRDGWIQRRY